MSKLVYFILPVGMLFSGITWINFKGVDQVDQALSMMADREQVEAEAPIADRVEFCGELVPTQELAIKARLDREMNRLIFDPAGSDLIYNRSLRYRETFERILVSYGVPKDLFYLAVAESNLANATSPVGAQGFWQFMEPTALQYGLEVSETVDERFHPVKATRAAARYLRDMHREFDDWALVAAAYNMGQGRLARTMDEQASENYYHLDLNKETSRYVFRVISAKNLLEKAQKYGIRLKKRKNYKPIASYSVKVTENIEDLVTFANENGTSYELLKTLNPWLIASYLTVETGMAYEIRLPLVEDVHAPELRTYHWRLESRLQDSITLAEAVIDTPLVEIAMPDSVSVSELAILQQDTTSVPQQNDRPNGGLH